MPTKVPAKGEKMNWKAWLKYDLYKKLWSLIGKRPWTFIYRDVWHQYEWFPQIQWLATGIAAEWARQYWQFPWWAHLVWIGIYTYGYINGHFFWGTKWLRSQKGK